ncbi:Putative LOC663964, partial [Caligus rogercresseyi]
PASLSCPLCPFSHEDESSLNQHINRVHFAEEAPAVSSTSASHVCPLCFRKDFSSASELSSHVDSHVSGEFTHRADHLLAMNLAREEEDRNFKKLQNEFGMTQESRSFGEQSISGMERAVHQGEMSVMDYHERR